jgi:hypothetical protein
MNTSLLILWGTVAVWATIMLGCDREDVSTTYLGYRSQLYSVTYDNHLFILSGNGGICHHPDCGCLKKKTIPTRF